MPLPDPSTSGALLIGCATYRDLEPLPAVANNLERLNALLTSADLWGLPQRNCRVLLDPESPVGVLDAVHKAAVEAVDTLVVYFAGHGLVDPSTDELLLGLPGSTANRLYTAVRYEDLRREMVDVARASAKVVLLDCCYSGLAMRGMMSGPSALADHARIEGTYLMTASADGVRARAPIGDEFTEFTGALIAVLEQGLPEGPDLLDMETLYGNVRSKLRDKGGRRPQQRAGNSGAKIVLVRNRRGISPTARPVRAVRVMPPVPPGFEAIIAGRPWQIASQVRRLREESHARVVNDLLTAAAARCPDQEVASLITHLRRDHHDTDADHVIVAAASRPPGEVAALAVALRDTQSGEDADRLITAVAAGSADEIGALAETLSARGQNDDVHRLVEASVKVSSKPDHLITVVDALSSVGLAGEIDRMLKVAAKQLTIIEAVGLADALLAEGRDQAAFTLYLAILEAAPERPAEEIASWLGTMQRVNASESAKRLVGIIGSMSQSPDKVFALVHALLSTNSKVDTSQVLDAAAAGMTSAEVLTLAEGLGTIGYHGAVFDLFMSAADRRPAEEVIHFVQKLRAADRPVDGNRLLDSTQKWPLEKTIKLLEVLQADRTSDAERVLVAAAQRLPGDVCDLAGMYHARGQHEQATKLLAAAAQKCQADALCALIGTFRKARRHTDASQLLGQAALTRDASELGALVGTLRTEGRQIDVLQLLDTAASERDIHKLCELIMALRTARYDPEANRLLNTAASRNADDQSVLTAALRAEGLHADVTLLLDHVAQRAREPSGAKNLAALIVTFRELNRHADADNLLETVQKCGLRPSLYTASALRRRGQSADAERLRAASRAGPVTRMALTIERLLRIEKHTASFDVGLDTGELLRKSSQSPYR